MIIALLSPFLIASDSGPLGEALEATEAPSTLRAAFTVLISSGEDWRLYTYDPRRPVAERWRHAGEYGENDELDRLGAEWGSEPAPDSRLFPDDLRASLSETVEAEDFGGAWRVRFRHRPSLNDAEFDVWAAEHFVATAWIDPVSDRFLRIDHELPRPVAGPDGGRLMAYRQSHFLETDPEFGVSVITGISVELEARGGFRTIERSYVAQITDVELFFASAADREAFLAAQLR